MKADQVQHRRGMILALACCAVPTAVTLALLLAFQVPLSRHFPALSPIYAVLGVDVVVPGADLRLSALQAERKIEGETSTLTMAAQLSNQAATAQAYPALTATAFDDAGVVVKSWNLPAPAQRSLASGEEAPIRAVFKDAPDSAVQLELRVNPQ